MFESREEKSYLLRNIVAVPSIYLFSVYSNNLELSIKTDWEDIIGDIMTSDVGPLAKKAKNSLLDLAYIRSKGCSFGKMVFRKRPPDSMFLKYIEQGKKKMKAYSRVEVLISSIVDVNVVESVVKSPSIDIFENRYE